VIRRIRCGFIENTDWFFAQLHELAFEANVADSGDILVPVSPIILKEQRHNASTVEQRSFDGILLHIVALRQIKGLSGRQISRGAKINIVPIDVQLERERRGRRGGSAKQDGVQSDLASESNILRVSLVTSSLDVSQERTEH
jgi:hypothetical protein